MVYLTSPPDHRILFSKNLRGNDLYAYFQQFKNSEKRRLYQRKNNNKVIHHVLALNPESSPFASEEIMKDLAEEFCRLKGKDVETIAVMHRGDNGNFHIHIMESGCDRLGYANRLDHQSYSQVKHQLQEYQQKQYPELHQSVVAHGSGSYRRQKQTSGQNTTAFLKKEIKQAFEKYSKFFPLELALAQREISFYFRGKTLQGVLYKGKKYRFTRIGVQAQTIKRMYAKQQQHHNVANQNITQSELLRSQKRQTHKA